MPVRIGPLWALLIGFIVLIASNSWLKGIFGYGEIATDVPFLLTGLTLFAIWKFNRRGQARNTLMGGTSRFVIWTAAVGTNGQQKPERCRKVY